MADMITLVLSSDTLVAEPNGTSGDRENHTM